MALEVAALLDGLQLGTEAMDKAVTGMNKALSLKKVALDRKAEATVMVTIGDRSYLFSSTSGVVQVSALEKGPETTKAMASCDSRLYIDPTAFNSEAGNLGEEWEVALKERRKMRIEGDYRKYALCHNALLNQVSTLSASVPASARAPVRKTTFTPELEPPSTQIANVYEDSFAPLCATLRGWLLFSAVSSMNGNMGQSNYCAANMVMDNQTFYTRQIKPFFEAITMMWGTVGHMGMRWKAFGSADFIYYGEDSKDVVMMPADAQAVLHSIFTDGFYPEWFVSNTFDKATATLFANGGPPMSPTPWGKKGKGGGTAVYEEGEFSDAMVSFKGSDTSLEKSQATSGSMIYEGRRVRLHGLTKNANMNGKKGVLVAEAEDGHWVVRLDGNLGDKMLKLEKMMTLSGTKLAVA